MTTLEVLTDEDEETIGQQPQEAGGEAMISEETSASSSSEEDDSSVSSGGDIPWLMVTKHKWSKAANKPYAKLDKYCAGYEY